MKLSIIIVSYNVCRDLVDCIKSIEENCPDIEFEIIVTDNAGTDGTVRKIRSDFPQVILIENKENRGFSAANNQAIKIAKGEYLFLLNPDTIIHPRSIGHMVKVLDENPDVGACGPGFAETDGTIARSVGYVPTLRSLLYRNTFFRSLGIFRGHYRKLTSLHVGNEGNSDVEQLSGAALMVRASVMREIGLMDENFFLYYEDVDLCLRIRKAGWRIIYVPGALITHTGGQSTSQISTRKRIILYKSMFIYMRKHRGRPATALFGLIFKPAVIIREILDLFTVAATFFISLLSFNRKRRLKSVRRLKNTANFFLKYFFIFLFKV